MSMRALSPVPDDLASELVRLHAAGFSLLPLGRGVDGKAPLLGFSGTERLPLRRVLAPMHRTGSRCYGIRLHGLVVVDCDSDDPDLVSAMEARFGASSVQVCTPRGRHLYYRAPEVGRPTYPNLRAEGLAIDLKRGASSYVMGPGSVRPDGGAYHPAKGLLGRDELPVIRLGSLPARVASGAATAPLVQEPLAPGQRHDALVRTAVALVAQVDSAAELLSALRAVRDSSCKEPLSLPDGELQGIAEWAWRCRLEGRVYHDRMSAFRVERAALDALRGAPNRSDATALFVTLHDQHGHRPGYAFALDHEAMLAVGLTDLTRRRFRAARDTLLARDLLQVAASHSAGRRSRTYRLSRPLMVTANVAPLHRAGEERGRV